MSKFHKDNEVHARFGLLFDSCKIENKFKQAVPDCKFTIVKDKEEARFSSMLNSAGSIGSAFVRLQTSAIECIALAATPQEAYAISLGLIPVIPQGIMVCPGCLERSILTCQENLEVLKDIQEAIKKYAINA